jgi:hypothetical protein
MGVHAGVLLGVHAGVFSRAFNDERMLGASVRVTDDEFLTYEEAVEAQGAAVKRTYDALLGRQEYDGAHANGEGRAVYGLVVSEGGEDDRVYRISSRTSLQDLALTSNFGTNTRTPWAWIFSGASRREGVVVFCGASCPTHTSLLDRARTTRLNYHVFSSEGRERVYRPEERR